jgi:hypothetical protein
LRGGNIVFDTYPTGTLTNRTDENIRMTILSNGNVGIGTTTPTALLDVNGDVLVAGDLTAENLIVGSTNVITEITALQTLTATHTTDIASNTADILNKQDLIDISITLEGFNISENINFLNSTQTDFEYLDYNVLNTLRLRTETFETTLTANNIELAGDLSVSGLITQSNTIRFKAYYNLGENGTFIIVGAGNKIPYNTTQYDVGNGYDGVNYKYVVPVAGLYFFGGTWFKNSTSIYIVDYQKNGITIRRNECQFSSGGFSVIPTFIIEDCDVGDKISLKVISGSILVAYSPSLAPDGWTHFEGYRIG